MKLPRDVSGQQLVALLAKFGYQQTRQVGSHIRVTTQLGGEHHVTIPNHSTLRIGTLSFVISEVAAHIKMTKEEAITKLFE